MKTVTVYCPKCGHKIVYRNWFMWILNTPFHWFGARRIKCINCGIRSYVKRGK